MKYAILLLLLASCGQEPAKIQLPEMICVDITAPFVGTICKTCIEKATNDVYVCTKAKKEETND